MRNENRQQFRPRASLKRATEQPNIKPPCIRDTAFSKTTSRAAQSDGRKLSRHDRRFVLAQGAHHLPIQLQMRLHQFGRRQRQPLVERHVGVVAALEISRKRNGVLPVFST